MRFYHFIGGLAALLLSACAAEQSEAGANVTEQLDLAATPSVHQLVNSLVDSFDAPACLDSQLRFAGRKDFERSVFHQRRFDASDKCLRDLEQSAAKLGFKKDQSGNWSGSIVGGTEERLKFPLDEDLTQGNLLWEVDVT